MIVGQPTSTSKGFRCPYHHWTYSLEGELIAIPGEDAYQGSGFERARVGLVPLRIEDAYGLLFACLDRDAPSLADYLGPDLVAVLEAPLGQASYEVFHFDSWLLRANWKQGNCLETPAEPADSRFYLTVKHRAYPVREQYGLYWAYLGPPPAPVLPRWDIASFGSVQPTGAQRFDCNWLQGMENHMDQSHIFILHQDTAQRGMDGMSTARGRIDSLKTLEYTEVPFGIRRRQTHTGGYDDIDLMIFPNAQRTYNHVGVRVPIDDTHMVRYSVWVDVELGVPVGNPSGKQPGDLNGGLELRQGLWPTKNPPDGIYPAAEYRMDGVQAQDLMALETQGAIADRTAEHLASSDRGIMLYRDILKREIEKVQRGLDPIGVIRDPGQPPINTYIENWLDVSHRFPPDHPTAEAVR